MLNKSEEWMQTVTGRKFFPFAPKPEDIFIEDIAHALSHMCRFNGHCVDFYSVAEHSIHCSNMGKSYGLTRTQRLALLLHDASEAYVADMIRPVKRHLPEYSEIERGIMEAVAQRFGVSFDFPELHVIDNRVLLTEKRDIMGPSPELWNIPFAPYSEQELVLIGMSPVGARKEFLRLFAKLRGLRNYGEI